jgi:hypothetical protein
MRNLSPREAARIRALFPNITCDLAVEEMLRDSVRRWQEARLHRFRWTVIGSALLLDIVATWGVLAETISRFWTSTMFLTAIGLLVGITPSVLRSIRSAD